MVQTTTKRVLRADRNRHRTNGAKAGNEDLTTSGTEPKGRPGVVLGRCIPLKSEHGVFSGGIDPSGTKNRCFFIEFWRIKQKLLSLYR